MSRKRIFSVTNKGSCQLRETLLIRIIIVIINVIIFLLNYYAPTAISRSYNIRFPHTDNDHLCQLILFTQYRFADLQISRFDNLDVLQLYNN